MLLVPVGFLVGVLRARLARSGLTRLLVELPEEAPLAEAEAAL